MYNIASSLFTTCAQPFRTLVHLATKSGDFSGLVEAPPPAAADYTCKKLHAPPPLVSPAAKRAKRRLTRRDDVGGGSLAAGGNGTFPPNDRCGQRWLKGRRPPGEAISAFEQFQQVAGKFQVSGAPGLAARPDHSGVKLRAQPSAT